ncbi:GAF and ANTAR domain-containing protein [Phycicoccus ginsengisoli]
MSRFVPAPEHDLARYFAELVHAVQADGGRHGTLLTVCELAVKIIRADHASISVRRGDVISTLATTGDLPETVDRIQDETGEGPCVDGLLEHDSYATGDLCRDGRWPRFAARVAEETGLRSMLSHRLFAREGSLGALNVYAARPDAFASGDLIVSEVFAAHAAIAVQAAEDQQRADNLEIALRSSRRIGTAIGILMASHRVDEQTAFEMLRRRSQDTNRKLADIADDVVYTGLL